MCVRSGLPGKGRKHKITLTAPGVDLVPGSTAPEHAVDGARTAEAATEGEHLAVVVRTTLGDGRVAVAIVGRRDDTVVVGVTCGAC